MKRMILSDLSASAKGSRHWVKFLWCVAGLFLVSLLSLDSISWLVAHASGKREADRVAITNVLTNQQSAWNRGDVQAFLEGYWRSKELTFAGSSGVSRGWDAVFARYQKNYPDRAAMGTLDFSGLEYRFLGPDAALLLGRWHLKRESGDIGGVFSLVLQRFPEGWRIVHDHTSLVADTK